jgi:pentapeptide MXKDX repeat protein
MHGFTRSLLIAVSLFAIFGLAVAQDQMSKDQMSKDKMPHKMAAKKAELSDAQYSTQALTAAPKAIAKEAGVVRMQEDGSMKTLRDSKNGFNCMIILGNTMCADSNSMEFFNAMMKKQNPPDKLGISYMLGGDKGASNTDPTATKKTADNHWVVTGPHIMIVGPAAKQLGIPDSADADPTKPYLMWANTPYAHAMIPVAGGARTRWRTDMKDRKEMK